MSRRATRQTLRSFKLLISVRMISIDVFRSIGHLARPNPYCRSSLLTPTVAKYLFSAFLQHPQASRHLKSSYHVVEGTGSTGCPSVLLGATRGLLSSRQNS